jgi:hypothetical protein
LPIVLVGTLTWLFHWRLVKAQSDVRETEPEVVFAPPRRPGIVLLALLGLFAAAPAVVSLLWVGFDWAIQHSSTLSGDSWWRDRTSFSLTTALIGGATWLIPWLMMQRAAVSSPTVEGSARARRNALALVVTVGAVVALGFAVAALWLVLQFIFGVPFDPTGQSLLVKALASLLVAAGIARYHGVILRTSGGLRGAPTGRHRLVALVTPGSSALLAEIRQMRGVQVQLVLELSSAPPAESDVPSLRKRLESLAIDGQSQRTLVILHPDGGSLYPIAG